MLALHNTATTTVRTREKLMQIPPENLRMHSFTTILCLDQYLEVGDGAPVGHKFSTADDQVGHNHVLEEGSEALGSIDHTVTHQYEEAHGEDVACINHLT